ncbi:MAG: nucleotidyltransferase domain-containing protein [Deltaproteobacteria bacterium]|nr:nucleotidyltransferase domain-containing protein [Deltaproteobacteria bacterium]
MIDIDPGHLAQIAAILGEHVPDCEIRVFGSRVGGAAARFSDIDLVLIGTRKLDRKRIEALKDAFAESDLPIMVDVLDWHAITRSFRNVIDTEYEVVQKPAGRCVDADVPASHRT